MKWIQRSYQDEGDFWAIRSFLRDVFLRNGRREISWPVARLDYWRWHGILNAGEGPLKGGVFLWETEDGELAAVLNCESPGYAYFQIDPRYRTPQLEEEMLDLAEERLVTVGKRSGRPALAVWVTDGDTLREEMLARRGYERKADWQSFIRYRALALPIPEPKMPEGYTFRPMTLEDIPARSWASWRAFHPDEPDEGCDRTGSWYLNILCAPTYRRDLDLVAIAEDGAVAAFATVWYDDVTRFGYFEPVGTMPEHQRKGLATSLLYEGMRRLKERGAEVASVGGGGLSNPRAEGVYASAFGDDRDSYVGWLKYLDGQPAPNP